MASGHAATGYTLLKRMLTSIAFIAITVWVCLCLLVYLFQDRLIYFPSKRLLVTPADVGMSYEEVQIETADQLRLKGWYIKAEQPRATLLFFHGNAGNISHRLESIDIFLKLNLSVLIIDYRGYGHSQGKPSEYGFYQDALAAWDYLIRQGHSPNEIILFGRSLGAAVAAYLGSKKKPAAIILESAFTSATDMARKYYPYLPVRWLLRVRYPIQEYVSAFESPVLIIHSPDDDIVPFVYARRLLESQMVLTR